jgi:hypothetical protein
VSPSVTAYASYGVNGREPARSDMFAGFDNIDTSNVAFVGPLGTVKPERVHDTEFGVRKRAGRWLLDANAFLMEFRNEILPVGDLSYIGTPLRTNVPSSYRRGVELDGSAEFGRLHAGATATLTIYRYTGAPAITIDPITPPAGGSTITVTGTVGEGVVSGDVNGIGFTPAAGRYSVPNVSLNKGLNVVTARARNGAGRRTSWSDDARIAPYPPGHAAAQSTRPSSSAASTWS